MMTYGAIRVSIKTSHKPSAANGDFAAFWAILQKKNSNCSL
jgi:hypothetical protein